MGREAGRIAAKPQQPAVEAVVVMGQIAAPYGVRGWVKVKPYSEHPQTLEGYALWWLQRPAATDWQSVPVVNVREHSGSLVAQLAGIESREAAMGLRGALVGIPRVQLPQPARGEVYHADLVGLDVVNRGGVRLGRVAAVEEFGAHPVLRIDGGEGGRERLVPFVPAYVDGVDLASRRIDVDWEADY